MRIIVALALGLIIGLLYSEQRMEGMECYKTVDIQKTSRLK